MSVEQAVLMITGGVAGLVAFLKAVSYLTDKFKKGMNTVLKPVTDELHSLRKSVCTNYIVRFLSDIEHGENLDDVEWQRFWENYETYIELGGNSYIRDKVEKLRKQQKI